MIRSIFTLALTCLTLGEFVGVTLGGPANAFAETREFIVNAVEKNNAEKIKTKYWLPATFTVKKGDTVVFHLKNKIKGPNNIHGFAIKDYGIAVLVDGQGIVKNKDANKDAHKDAHKDAKDQEKDVKFIADKVGEFDIKCHLHPAHVGGQLVVQE